MSLRLRMWVRSRAQPPDHAAGGQVWELAGAWPAHEWGRSGERCMRISVRPRGESYGRDEEECDEQRESVRARCGSPCSTAAPPGRQETNPERKPTRILAATVSRFTLRLRGRFSGGYSTPLGDDPCRHQSVHVWASFGVRRLLPVNAQAPTLAKRRAPARPPSVFPRLSFRSLRVAPPCAR